MFFLLFDEHGEEKTPGNEGKKQDDEKGQSDKGTEGQRDRVGEVEKLRGKLKMKSE